MKPIIALDRVSKSFVYWENKPHSKKRLLVQAVKGKVELGVKRQINVLEDISFQINQGEFVGIMGRNGAGKSTTLKIIAGIYAPSQGRVIINGKIAPLLELGAGFAEDLSGYENIFLNASILGFNRKQTNESLKSIIEFSELGDMIQMPVRTYSSGMLVRLGFSIAAHLDAPILLFDEILAVGDAGFQRKCMEKIDSLYKQGRSIILVTHSTEQIEAFCSRCLVIDRRKLIFDGTPKEGAKAYKGFFENGHKRSELEVSLS